MDIYTDKLQRNRDLSAVDDLSQRHSSQRYTFQFKFNPQGKQSVQFRGKSTENVIQRVEAGEVPIMVKKGDKDTTIEIKGLNMCVGVLIRIYGEGSEELNYVALVGGHFVTPTMFKSGKSFTEEGNTFISAVQELIKDIDKARLEPVYHIGTDLEDEEAAKKLESYKQAEEAATAIKQELDIGGTILLGAANISEQHFF